MELWNSKIISKKKFWYFIKYNKLDPYTVRILGKLLKDTPFLAFAAIRFKLHLFLNNAC